NAGRVSSLRRKTGELDNIQLDVAIDRDNSRGPVLDDQGRLVGVIVARSTPEKRVAFAVPASHVARFLARPAIELSPAELKRESLNKPAEFTARVVSMLPGAREPSVRLILRAADEEPREFAMSKRG